MTVFRVSVHVRREVGGWDLDEEVFLVESVGVEADNVKDALARAVAKMTEPREDTGQ